jgi:hypothetical protein
MGIATKIWRHRVMSRFLALVYAPTVIKPGYKPPKKAIILRRPALLLLMPDPVNAWTHSSRQRMAAFGGFIRQGIREGDDRQARIFMNRR